jgi:hypothetical protein
MDFVKTYWRVLWALCVAIWLSIRAFQGGQVITVAELAKVLTLALGALVSLHLAESFDLNLKFKKNRTDLQADLKAAIETAERRAAYIVEFKAQSDYADLFGDLTGDFFSYNPHQFSHQTVALDEEQIIESMRRRYENPAFSQAWFLICVGDDYGESNFARFALRLKKVASTRTSAADIARKVRVRVSTKAFVPEVTFHLQQKHGADRAVAELRLPGLTIGASPVPRHYLITRTQSIRAALRAYFEQEWATAESVNLESLSELNDTDTWDQVSAKLSIHRTRRHGPA